MLTLTTDCGASHWQWCPPMIARAKAVELQVLRNSGWAIRTTGIDGQNTTQLRRSLHPPARSAHVRDNECYVASALEKGATSCGLTLDKPNPRAQYAVQV